MAHSTRPALDALSGARGALSQLLGGQSSALRLGFYAALRRVECLYRDAPRFGEAVDPALEPVRFGQEPSLAFRAAALTALVEGDEHRPAKLSLSFFGMYGPAGPLPTHLTQYADDRRRHHGDRSLIGFLDIFHHRFTSLLYRAWANAQPTVDRDRPQSDRFARYLGAIIGQSTSLRPGPPSELDDTSLHTAIHFASRTRHAEGLVKVLRACFGVEIGVEEFVGQWLEIPPEYCWLVPSSAASGTAPIGVLGESTRVGTQVWDRQSKFRVIVGPLAHDDYQRFLPGGVHMRQLIELVQRYAGPELGWDIRLILRESDRRAVILGSSGCIGRTANLGQSDGGAVAFEELTVDPLDPMIHGAQT